MSARWPEEGRLHPDDLEALVEGVAQRVAELLGPKPAGGLLTAQEVAERYGVTRDWAYENATRLGAIRLGDGPRARLRFDPERVAEVMTSCSTEGRLEQPEPRTVAPKREVGRNRASGTTVPLLPVAGLNEA